MGNTDGLGSSALLGNNTNLAKYVGHLKNSALHSFITKI